MSNQQQYRFSNTATEFNPDSQDYLATVHHDNPALNLNQIHTNTHDFNRTAVVVCGTPVMEARNNGTQLGNLRTGHVHGNTNTNVHDSNSTRLALRNKKEWKKESEKSSLSIDKTGSKRSPARKNRTSADMKKSASPVYGECPPEHQGLPSQLKIEFNLNTGDVRVGEGKFNRFQVPKPYFTNCECVLDPHGDNLRHRLESSLQVFTHGDKQWEMFLCDLLVAAKVRSSPWPFRLFNLMLLLMFGGSLTGLIISETLYMLGPVLMLIGALLMYNIISSFSKSSAKKRSGLRAIWSGDQNKMHDLGIGGIQANNWERFFEQHGYRAFLFEHKDSSMILEIMIPQDQFMNYEVV